MTNKDKFLRDGVSVEEFAEFLKSKQPNNKYDMTFHDIAWWLNAKATPTLTEDEKVILRNIVANHKTIFRDRGGDLWTRDTDDEDWTFYQFNHLFQFIQNEEEYEIEELLNGDKS